MRWCSSTSPSAHTRACFSACSTSPLGHAERRTACAMSPPPWTGKQATYPSRTATVGLGYAVEYLALAGSAQAVIYVVAATSGLMATAGFRAALTIFGPLNV